MEYGAQTVNERIYTSGNQKRFDKALKIKDIDTLNEIFKEINLEGYNIDLLFDQVNYKSKKNKNILSKLKSFLIKR